MMFGHRGETAVTGKKLGGGFRWDLCVVTSVRTNRMDPFRQGHVELYIDLNCCIIILDGRRSHRL